MRRTFQATPVTSVVPAPARSLFPRAPMVPATWVPWPCSSRGSRIPVDGVPAAAVVDVAVAVVVDAVAGHLPGVHPHVGGEVGVVVGDAGVHDGDDHVRAAGGDVPRLRGVDVGVGGAGWRLGSTGRCCAARTARRSASRWGCRPHGCGSSARRRRRHHEPFSSAAASSTSTPSSRTTRWSPGATRSKLRATRPPTAATACRRSRCGRRRVPCRIARGARPGRGRSRPGSPGRVVRCRRPPTRGDRSQRR